MNKYNNILTELKKYGNDVRIHNDSVIVRPELVEVGSHIAIDMWVYLSTKATLGSYIHIAPSVSIIGGAGGELIMENFSNIGSGGKIVCATDDFKQGLISPVVPIEYRTVISEPVIFKKFATLGVNCVVLPGVTLAEGCIVGAGAVVTKDTEPWGIYAGVPAKFVGMRDKNKILESAKILEDGL